MASEVLYGGHRTHWWWMMYPHRFSHRATNWNGCGLTVLPTILGGVFIKRPPSHPGHRQRLITADIQRQNKKGYSWRHNSLCSLRSVILLIRIQYDCKDDINTKQYFLLPLPPSLTLSPLSLPLSLSISVYLSIYLPLPLHSFCIYNYYI